MNQESQPASGSPHPGGSNGADGVGEATRPAFHQPGPPGGRRGVPAAVDPPAESPAAGQRSTPGHQSTPGPQSTPGQPFVNQQQAAQQPQPPAGWHNAYPPTPQPGTPPGGAGTPQSGTPQPGMPQPGMPQPGMPQSGTPQSGTPQSGGYAPAVQQHTAVQQQSPYSSQPPGPPQPGPPPPPGPSQQQPPTPRRQSYDPVGQRNEQRSTGSPIAYLRVAANAATGSNGRVGPAGWTLRGLGLLAISLVSGLVWLAIKPGGPETSEPPTQQPGPRTDHAFERIRWEEGAQSCKSVSTSKIQEYFASQECEHLTRALYTTELADGRRVLTSVVTVLMPNEGSARELEQLTTKNNTGNIKDLVEEGRPGLENHPDLYDKAYGSALQGRLVAVGDSAYFEGKTPKNDPGLEAVTADALKLGWPQDKDE